MLLSKTEQDEFFKNYLPLLYYAAIYEGLLPEGSSLSAFIPSPMEVKIESRDALFTDGDIIRYFRQDNGRHLSKGGMAFLEEVEKGMLDDFILLKQYTKFSVLLKDEKFYQVLNITEPFSVLISYIPNYINTAIFNFKGKIICDGLIRGGNIQIGPNNERTFLEDYKIKKKEGKIITMLP